MPPRASEPAPDHYPIRVCVLKDGELAEVEVTYRAETGDTLVGGRLFREVHPTTSPPYAGKADWYLRYEPVTFRGRTLTHYGLPRVLGTNEVERVGEFRGVPVFVERGTANDPITVLFLPVRTGCEFQPYQNAVTSGSTGP